ncbi:cilia- and flagella-associated protein 54 isoform X3 [Electrophorus electricus]|uniref:cilia- and flagella-associated protein 54 isoform X3 n=1 Tax=Electrophorus electricus TaxID=8005 RepID=UPI0015D0766E|nr:cilia- and flagella-associated protein 54 isoform X3 [Electrophorus electricus]
MDPLPASYYGQLDKSNPVISAFERDLKQFKSYMKRLLDSANFDHFSYSRGSVKLFDIWKKYKPRLPSPYYEEQLMQLADFLFQRKFYSLALWQGYRRYLHQICTASLESIKNVEHFKQSFFPEGFHTEGAKLTFCALQRECLCVFYLERERCRQPDYSGMQKLLSILAFLRIMMQAILPHESLCWLLYNGTLCIYEISRFLMSVSHSAQALDFLLWACVCLETSIPLLTPGLLPWRATLYCAVCACYYDEQAAVQAEVFARRALGKIRELEKLVEMSDSLPSAETQQAFKEATIKLAVMVFKRSVYEPRRKSKGIFKYKQKGNVREGHNGVWPRSLTERILMELFVGNAAQFLAVLEALRDTSRRPLPTGMSKEAEIQDVELELIMAGISILSGSGGSSDLVCNDSLPSSLSAITTTATATILELATAGENRISVDAAVTFVKLLFRYEQWDMFCTLSDSLVTVLSNMEGCPFQRDELELTLLRAAERVLSTHRVHLGTRDIMAEGQPDKDKFVGLVPMTDELLDLVQTLHACVCDTAQDMQPDGDLVLDIVLFVWEKCKLMFQRAQARPNDSVRYMGKMEYKDKWLQALSLLCGVASACHLADIDLVAVAEMTFRLVMALEASIESHPQSSTKTAEDHSLQSISAEKYTATCLMPQRSRAEHLEMACGVLERGLECVSRGRTVSLPCNASAICDNVFMQKFGGTHVELFESGQPEGTSTSCVSAFFMDLHVELLAFQHRVSLKLLDTYSDVESVEVRKRSVPAQGQPSETQSERTITECLLVEKIKKNKISKALFLAQKALLSYKKDTTNTGTKKFLEEAVGLMEKAEVEERRLNSASAPAEMGSDVAKGCRPPPPPVLLSRTNCSMTFTPAPYSLEGQVCWYRIYGREVEGVSLKVRIGDCHLPGTGEMIPSRGVCLLCVSGLEPNQKYLFAVAAYDAQGNLLGNTIGDTTRPLLASLPLPLLTTWAHLAQVAYQTGQYAVAKKACSELWSHFTLPSSPDPGAPQEPLEKHLEGLAQTRLRWETLQLSSPLLQQLFLSSIFVQTDIHIQEKALHCDSLADGSSFIWGQEARLAECERMLVAIDLALYLNESSDALQATVTCYSLLAPLIYYQIPSDAVIQVLLKCLVVLHEIAGVLRQKRPAAAMESLQHMVACITHYVAKGLRCMNEYRMALSVMDQGKELLQQMAESLLQPSKPAWVQQDGEEILQKKAANAHKVELCVQLNALEASVWKDKKMAVLLNDNGTTWNRAAVGSLGDDLSGQEDPAVLHMVIGCSSLKSAFRDVMKFKRKSRFIEFAALLLEKALLEDQLQLLPQWGQEILNWLKRRDEDLTVPKKPQGQSEKDSNNFTSSVIEYSTKKQKVGSVWCDKKTRELQKGHFSGPGVQISERGVMELMVRQLTPLVRRHRRRRRLRQISSEEWPWRCQLNLALARAHLGLLSNSLQARTGAPPQQCYSKMQLLSFSLARTGTLVKWKNTPQHIRAPQLNPPIPKPTFQPKGEPTLHKANDTSQGTENAGEESGEIEGENQLDSARTQLTNQSDSSEPSAPVIPATSHLVSQPLDILSKATVHLRRAMVLAHRGGQWTSLQWACGILWDQFCTMAVLVEQNQGSNTPDPFTLDQYYTVFTPLFALASDLLMDMGEKLQLWEVYNEGGEEVEARQQGGGASVDLCWLRSVVLHTLELLHYQAKWETLAHLALLYNCYTREHYAHVIIPVLVYAQKRLLERISHCGGPPAPQPHFTHTETVTGEKVTYRNYAGKQLLLHHHSSMEGWLRGGERDTAPEPLELAEVNRAMCVVRVPLDVQDTVQCLREMQLKGSYAHHAFQHSRTLLLLLLADTQHLEVPFCMEFSSGGRGRVEFDPVVITAPAIGPLDLSNRESSWMGSVWSSPLPPFQIQAVLASYGNSIKFLQANKYHALRVQALHDLGNLHFYSRNQKDAHSHWSKALDCALLTTGVLESWDGKSWGSSSSQHPLRHAGIRGCLQGAVLSAKIAQYVLTDNISQRTKCCLLSAKLFKCLLRVSLPHPDNDLDYCSYTLKTELIPGVELFSESDWSITGSVVSSIGFLCHWLYSSGHHLTALPLLALYQYIASNVCRDPYLTVSCRILKVKVLTELSLFAEAMTEIHSLMLGVDVPQSYRDCSRAEKDQYPQVQKFMNHKPLMDVCNLQVLEEVVNKRPSVDVLALYGPILTHRLLLAKIQLISAMCSTIHDLPEALASGTSWTSESSESQVKCSMTQRGSSTPDPPNAKSDQSPCSNPTMNSSKPEGLQLVSLLGETLTLGHVKALLLREASVQLSPQLLGLQNIHTDPEELELAVESRLLLSSLSLQWGQTAASADLAVSALRLLQDSPLFQRENPPPAPRNPLASVLKQSHERVKREQTLPEQPESAKGWWLRDVPAVVEAAERMGRCFWLRCRLAAVRSLTAHIPGTAIIPGLDSSMEADRLLKDGLAEAEAWGDPDTQALLLLQGVMLHFHCGKAPEESIAMLQEAVSLLSGRSALSLRSRLALAEATILLSERRGSSGQSLDLLAQRLLQQQLCALGECVILKTGGGLELPSNPGLMNIYNPQLPLLARTTMHLGLCIALQAMVNSLEEGEGPWKPWLAAQEVLECALAIAQASASRHHQLEADILYYKGMVGRVLMSLTTLQHQGVVESFLKSITLAHYHTHNLQLIHRCYVEMALIYLEQWQKSTATVAGPPAAPVPVPAPASSDKSQAWKRVRSTLNKNLTVGQSQLLLFWVCMRAATMTMEALTNCCQLCGFTGVTGVHIPLTSLKALPGFASNDLLHPCGGTEEPVQLCPSWTADTGNGADIGKKCQLTWVHLSRYYTHLLNLRHICTQPAEQCVEGLLSVGGDPFLALRLNQLHTFFHHHLASYREKCVTPDPPAALILEPHVLQLSHTAKVCVRQPKQPLSDLYPWATVDTPQLRIQWHRPTLERRSPPPDTIVLVFGFNKAPLSAMHPSAVALADLEAGRRLISLDRLKALHGHLISACVEASVDSTVPVSLAPSRTASLDRGCGKASDKLTPCSPQQMLLEKTRHICNEIRSLLKPDLKFPPTTEVSSSRTPSILAHSLELHWPNLSTSGMEGIVAICSMVCLCPRRYLWR